MDLQPITLPLPAAPGCAERWLVLTSAAALWESLGVPAAAIDFDRYILLAALRGECRTSGYSVRLTGAQQSGDTVQVQVQFSNPPAGAIALTVLTYPRDFALLPRAALNPGGRLTFRFVDGQGHELAAVLAEVE